MLRIKLNPIGGHVINLNLIIEPPPTLHKPIFEPYFKLL